jgi:hypothetical protein
MMVWQLKSFVGNDEQVKVFVDKEGISPRRLIKIESFINMMNQERVRIWYWSLNRIPKLKE